MIQRIGDARFGRKCPLAGSIDADDFELVTVAVLKYIENLTVVWRKSGVDVQTAFGQPLLFGSVRSHDVKLIPGSEWLMATAARYKPFPAGEMSSTKSVAGIGSRIFAAPSG